MYICVDDIINTNRWKLIYSSGEIINSNHASVFTMFENCFQYESFIKYVRNTFRKTNISNTLIRNVRNPGFSENFAYVLNGGTHTRCDSFSAKGFNSSGSGIFRFLTVWEKGIQVFCIFSIFGNNFVTFWQGNFFSVRKKALTVFRECYPQNLSHLKPVLT